MRAWRFRNHRPAVGLSLQTGAYVAADSQARSSFPAGRRGRGRSRQRKSKSPALCARLLLTNGPGYRWEDFDAVFEVVHVGSQYAEFANTRVATANGQARKIDAYTILDESRATEFGRSTARYLSASRTSRTNLHYRSHPRNSDRHAAAGVRRFEVRLVNHSLMLVALHLCVAKRMAAISPRQSRCPVLPGNMLIVPGKWIEYGRPGERSCLGGRPAPGASEDGIAAPRRGPGEDLVSGNWSSYFVDSSAAKTEWRDG